jgi:hypothetical protein
MKEDGTFVFAIPGQSTIVLCRKYLLQLLHIHKSFLQSVSSIYSHESS